MQQHFVHFERLQMNDNKSTAIQNVRLEKRSGLEPYNYRGSCSVVLKQVILTIQAIYDYIGGQLDITLRDQGKRSLKITKGQSTFKDLINYCTQYQPTSSYRPRPICFLGTEYNYMLKRDLDAVSVRISCLEWQTNMIHRCVISKANPAVYQRVVYVFNLFAPASTSSR